jgi:hypothetical protein
MRKLFRIVTPILAAAAIALGSGSAALAAAAPRNVSLDDAWCFQDVTITYCFDVTGHALFLDNKPGESVTINETTRTTVYESGVYAGESKSTTNDRFVFQDDGTVVMKTTVHTRSRIGDEDCTYHMVLRLADFEATVYHVNSTCGG